MGQDHPAADLTCARCGAPHTIIACPYVKAVEFEDGFADGGAPRISRVEFITPADYGPAPKPAPAPQTAVDGPDYPKL